MTREQMEAHLTLHGWIALDDEMAGHAVGGYNCEIYKEQLCVYSYHDGEVAHAQKEFLPHDAGYGSVIELSAIPDDQFWKLANYVIERGLP